MQLYLFNIRPKLHLVTLRSNSSKTEFLIISLKHQLSNIDNASLNMVNTIHSVRNLGFLFFSSYLQLQSFPPQSFTQLDLNRTQCSTLIGFLSCYLTFYFLIT